MNQIHFGIGVIAYGDTGAVRETVESVALQHLEENTRLTITIARDPECISELEIRELIAECTAEVSFVDIAAHHDTNVMRCEALPVLAEAIPNDANWVWTLEEGDRLCQENSLQLLAAKLRHSAYFDIDAVHVCDANRSFNSGYTERKDIDQFCEAFGYLEIVGKISSLVLRPQHFKFAFNQHLAQTATAAHLNEIWVSHYTHSQFLFLAMSKSKASMIDLKLIDQASGEAWSAPQNSVEWFKIARELIELGVTVGNNKKWDPHFFRYGTLSLWSELVRQQGVCAEHFTHEVTSDSTEMLHFLDQWQVILSLADYINHDGVRDIIYNVVTDGIRLTLDLLNSEDKSTDGLKAFFKKHGSQIQSYPTTLHHAEHIAQLMQKSA